MAAIFRLVDRACSNAAHMHRVLYISGDRQSEYYPKSVVRILLVCHYSYQGPNMLHK